MQFTQPSRDLPSRQAPATPLDLRDHRPQAAPYYQTLDRGIDFISRCHECGRLVTQQVLLHKEGHGLTPCCGTRRVREVRHLTAWEWIKIRLGLIDFPHRQQFLAEFARRGHAQS